MSKLSRKLNKLADFLKEDELPKDYEENWEDQLPGGLADERNPKDFDSIALAKGVWVEREHTDDFNKALEIAMDHLVESPEYYEGLEKMEEQLGIEDEVVYSQQLSPLRARRDYGT